MESTKDTDLHMSKRKYEGVEPESKRIRINSDDNQLQEDVSHGKIISVNEEDDDDDDDDDEEFIEV